MGGNKHLRIGLALVGGIAAVWVGVAFCLPVLLPFVIGLAVAALAEPPVSRLCAQGRLPRWAATALCVTAVFAMLMLLIWFLTRTVCVELSGLVQQLPMLLESISQPLEDLRQWLTAQTARIPDGPGRMLQRWVSGLFSGGSVVAERATQTLLSWMTGMVTGLPDVLLFSMTAVLASFMISARLPQLRRWIARRLPARWQRHYTVFWTQLRRTLSGWLRAQLKLMGVTFGIVSAGLWVLGVEYPLLFGGLISLVDALPVFGTGTVLIPWGCVLFLQGHVNRGLGMILLYGAAALTRTALEPRLLGRQLGLHPLLTLLALYAGYRLCGIAGMLLFPIGAILLKQLYDLVDTARQQTDPGRQANSAGQEPPA